MEELKKIIAETEALFDFKFTYLILPHYDIHGVLNGGTFKIYRCDDKSYLTSFAIKQMSGCNGIAISKGVDIAPEQRGKGYGTIFCELREKLCKQLGYSMMLCTIVLTNEPQIRIMEKRGWVVLQKFVNRKTNNEVCLYCKLL